MPIDQTELLARASIRGLFDPLALVGDGPGKQEALAFLAQRSSERQLGGRWLWVLDLDSRTQGLATLPAKPASLTQFLRKNPPEPDDLIGRMFQRALSARSRSAALAEAKAASGRRRSTLTAEEQVRLFQAVATLVEAKVNARQWMGEDAARTIRRSAAIRERIDAIAVLRPDRLRGRTREHRFLSDFVTRGLDAAQDGAKGKIEVRPVAKGKVPVVIVAGVGGIGKSALLATVTTDLIRRKLANVVSFDFDNPSLRQGQPIAMSLEFSRQLGLAEPAADAALSQSRVELRHVAASMTDIGAYESTRSTLLGVNTRWRDALAGTTALQRPLVLVLDTFEEVLGVSEERLRTISDWVADLVEQVGFTRLSMIISGRAANDITDLPDSALQVAAVLPLGDLGVLAGRAKLRDMFRRRGIEHEDLIASLVATFGSNPLVLEVLARFCEDKTRDEIVMLSAGDGGTGPTADPRLRAEFAQRFLYSRILERLPDERLKPLARPGLVLRRVTPQLIREVLAGPCQLGEVDVPTSQRMLADLKRLAWLVQPGGANDEALHRKELRRLMLPLLLPDPGAKAVLRGAIAWFEGRPDPHERLEALYYRGLDRDALEEVSAETLGQLHGVIGTDVDDLPVALRARIKRSVGNRLSAAELAALSQAEQAQIYSANASILVSEGLESAALEVGRDVFEGLAAPGSSFSPERLQDEDAALWRVQTSNVASAQSRFNTGQFASLAPNSLPLLRHLFRIIAGDAAAPIGRQADLALGHPAYLSALATFAVDREPIRGAFSEFLRDFPGRQKLAEVIGSTLRAPQDGRGATPLALLCCHLIGLDLKEVPGFADAVSASFTRWISPTSQANWRLTVLLAQYGLLKSAEPTADAFPLLSRTLASVLLPLPNSGDQPRWDTVPPPYEATLQLYLDDASLLERAVNGGQWPSEPGQYSQSLIVSMKRLAADVPLRLGFPERGPLNEHIGLALAPELRAPLRHELGTLSLERLRILVGSLSLRAAIWPQELSQQSFTRGAAGRLVPPLAEAVDDSGQWQEVADFLAGEDGITPIIRGMLSVWSHVKGTAPQS